MNFIKECAGTVTRLELKYCERCGGIFLRPPTAEVAYCIKCQARWLRLVSSKEKQPRKTKSHVNGRRSSGAGSKKSRSARLERLLGCGTCEVLQ
jgi:Zn-finger nucleic acid-binding protein